MTKIEIKATTTIKLPNILLRYNPSISTPNIHTTESRCKIKTQTQTLKQETPTIPHDTFYLIFLLFYKKFGKEMYYYSNLNQTFFTTSCHA